MVLIGQRKHFTDLSGICLAALNAYHHILSTVGINEAIIRRYVRYQGEQDTGQAQLEF
jgi:hypothetical protein